MHETIGVESTPDVSDKISQYKVKKNQTLVQAIWLSSVQFSPQSCLSLCDPMDCNTPGLPVHQQLLELTQTLSWVMPSNHLILCCPLLLPSSIFLSIRVFSDESVLHIRWPKCWSFSFSISPSNEYSGLISFITDWLDLLAVQGTLKSLPQYHSSKASILQHSAFFIVQLSHSYMTTGKTKAKRKWHVLRCSHPHHILVLHEKGTATPSEGRYSPTGCLKQSY